MWIFFEWVFEVGRDVDLQSSEWVFRWEEMWIF